MVSQSNLQPGDVLATHGRTCRGRAIQLCTGGWYDHVAIVGHRLTDGGLGELGVYEAWAGDRNGDGHGFRWLTVKQWFAQQRLLRSKVYRWPLVQPLDPHETYRLAARCENWASQRNGLGVPYDFRGAIQARRYGGRWATRWLVPCREDDGTLFCNESAGLIDRDVLARLTRKQLPNASAHHPSSYLRVARKAQARWYAGEVTYRKAA